MDFTPEEIARARKDDDKRQATFMAMVVRNAMEGFHAEHLTDEQMAELNPIIRNAIYTGLVAWNSWATSEQARQFIAFNMSMVPRYWEAPELLPDFQEEE
jgi:hypothetical protein